MNIVEANGILKFCIQVVQGKAILAPYNVILSFLLSCKKKLEEEGYLSHAELLDYWIHRFEQNKGFLKSKKALQPPSAVDRERARRASGGSQL